MRPGALARGETVLRRELKILEWQIKTKQVDGPEAKRRGHQALDRHYREVISEVEQAAAEHGFGTVDRDASELQQLLERSKEDWSRIVDDLLRL